MELKSLAQTLKYLLVRFLDRMDEMLDQINRACFNEVKQE